MNTPPIEIKLHSVSKTLEVVFDACEPFILSAEYLRVFSPSAEVQGHGGQGAVLQTGKQGISITDIFPVGNYAIGLKFSDGHDSGIFTWRYLHELGNTYTQKWEDYLLALKDAHASREASSGISTYTP